MTIAEAMIGEFAHESVGTRKMLERVARGQAFLEAS